MKKKSIGVPHYHVAPVIGVNERTQELLRDIHGVESPPLNLTDADTLRRNLNRRTVKITHITFRCFYKVSACRELYESRQTLVGEE